MGVEISTVKGRRDLREFVDLPFRLHAGTPWVTPLRLERRIFLNRRLNAYFTHGEAEYFLARRGGRVVGRITAQIDPVGPRSNATQKPQARHGPPRQRQNPSEALRAAGQRCKYVSRSAMGRVAWGRRWQ